ncbi:transposase family protein [Aneurinibacillus sp. Ricciae_BoGa-3]|uniref:transposase family protein n=1 Tax=Aneurinibacillus sp. Ricciae_BoGa-3 TaxID=3022697 RepID=UPI002340AA4E|nr:transposase family protein [Aneurinibacillus sp. Ricciae_BoGa-3]WCK52517.1 transposase family protein [Aneurinibacillus sp. Ricciae_BoGa-3]
MFSSIEEDIIRFEDTVKILNESLTENELFFVLEVNSTSASCPTCGSSSNRAHSRYTRHIDDLPISDRHIHFQLIVHKWFCDYPDCPVKVFTERLSWIKPYKRKTKRLEGVIRKIAFSTNCLTAEKVCHALHIPVSHDTLLRHVKSETNESVPSLSPFRRH